jgi:short-subunit dehydrogenase
MPGPVYALVNNAGTVGYGNYWEIDWDIHRRTLLVNLLVPARLMHLFLADMVRQGAGVVLNIGSVSGFQPDPYFSTYGATKAAVVSLSSGVGVELHNTGVTVCAWSIRPL